MSVDGDDVNTLAYFHAVAEHFITSIRRRQNLEKVLPVSGRKNPLVKLNELKQVHPPVFINLELHLIEGGYGEFVYLGKCTLVQGSSAGRRIEVEGQGPSKQAAKMAAAQRLLDHVALKPIVPEWEI